MKMSSLEFENLLQTVGPQPRRRHNVGATLSFQQDRQPQRERASLRRHQRTCRALLLVSIGTSLVSVLLRTPYSYGVLRTYSPPVNPTVPTAVSAPPSPAPSHTKTQPRPARGRVGEERPCVQTSLLSWHCVDRNVCRPSVRTRSLAHSRDAPAGP